MVQRVRSPLKRIALIGGGQSTMVLNSAFTIGTKALQAIATFATVHRLVHIWGVSGYGLWATLTAFALYISLFDLGVGYGVKNRISEAWGRGNLAEADDTVRVGLAIYVVAAIVALFCGIFVVLFVAPFKDHIPAAAILWVACVASFLLSFYNMVLQALARFKSLAVISLLSPCLWFLALQFWPAGRLMPLEIGAAIYSTTLVVQAGLIAVISVRVHRFRLGGWYRTRVSEFVPLMRIGAQFIALQLSAFALNGSGSFLVYRALGGADTAQYDAANKVFSVFTIAFSTLIAIAWTEISRAKAIGSQKRLAGIYRLLHIGVLLFFSAALLASWLSAPLTFALTGIRVPTSSTIAFAVFIGVQMTAFTSGVFLNAFERLRAQILAAIASIPIFVSVALGLLHAGWGVSAIPVASTAAMLPCLTVCLMIARTLIVQPDFGKRQGAALDGAG